MSFLTAFFKLNRYLQCPVSGVFIMQIFYCGKKKSGLLLTFVLAREVVTSSGLEVKRAFLILLFLSKCITRNTSEDGRDPLAFPSHCGYLQMTPITGSLTAVGMDSPHRETEMQNRKQTENTL